MPTLSADEDAGTMAEQDLQLATLLTNHKGTEVCGFLRLAMKISLRIGHSHNYTQKLHATYGPLVQISPEMVAVSDHNEIRRIYVTDDLPKSHLIYNNFRQDKDRPTLLTFTDKKAYGVRKRMVSSMFGVRYIRGMQPIMRQCVDVALKRLDDLCNQDPSGVAVVDSCNLVQSLAVDIIGDTTFGQSFNVVENGSHPLPQKLKQALRTYLISHPPSWRLLSRPLTSSRYG